MIRFPHSLHRLPSKCCHSINDKITSNVTQRASEQGEGRCVHSIKEVCITGIQLRPVMHIETKAAKLAQVFAPGGSLVSHNLYYKARNQKIVTFNKLSHRHSP